MARAPAPHAPRWRLLPALLCPLAAPRRPTPPDHLHRGAAPATAHRRSPGSAVAGVATAAWSCRLGTRGPALAAAVPHTPGQASRSVGRRRRWPWQHWSASRSCWWRGHSQSSAFRWAARAWGSGPEPGPCSRPGPAPGPADGGDAHRVAGAGGGGGTALAGRAAQAAGKQRSRHRDHRQLWQDQHQGVREHAARRPLSCVEDTGELQYRAGYRASAAARPTLRPRLHSGRAGRVQTGRNPPPVSTGQTTYRGPDGHRAAASGAIRLY